MRIPSMFLAFSSVRSSVSFTAGPRRLIALSLRGGSRSNMSSSSIVPTLVDATTAVAMHKAGKCKFLDGSWHMAKDRDANAEFLAERVPGACHFDIESIKDTTSDLPHMLPSATTFSTAMHQFGISNDDHLIVYARHGSFSAPRVWYMLKTFGHDKVSVLNGGFNAWKSVGGPVESGPITNTPSSSSTTEQYQTKFNPKVVVDATEVLNIVNTGCAQILDARSKGRFEGTAPEPRPHLIGGHMPGALSLPFTSIVQADDVTTFKSPSEIRDAFKDAGIIFGSRVVLTCGSGVSAAVLAMGLDLLGMEFENAPIYDGSWSEWGDPARADLPKIK